MNKTKTELLAIQEKFKILEKADLSKFNQSELNNHENSLKILRDLKGVIETAFDQGRIEGKKEVDKEVAKSAKQMGLSTNDIIKLTGLSESEIDKL